MRKTVSVQLTSGSASSLKQRKPILTSALWIIQGLLALLFLFAGSMKLIVPIQMLTAQMPLPGLFLQFIGVAEVAGAIGLILPGLASAAPAGDGAPLCVCRLRTPVLGFGVAPPPSKSAAPCRSDSPRSCDGGGLRHLIRHVTRRKI